MNNCTELVIWIHTEISYICINPWFFDTYSLRTAQEKLDLRKIDATEDYERQIRLLKDEISILSAEKSVLHGRYCFKRNLWSEINIIHSMFFLLVKWFSANYIKNIYQKLRRCFVWSAVPFWSAYSWRD